MANTNYNRKVRILSADEMDKCGLSLLGWANCLVDLNKYYPPIGAVAEVDAETYCCLRENGVMVQRVHDRCYMGFEMDATDVILAHQKGVYSGNFKIDIRSLL